MTEFVAVYLYLVGAVLSFTIFTLSWAEDGPGEMSDLGRAAFTVLWPVLAPVACIINLLEHYSSER